jgi:hypothetical protein
MIRIKTRTGEEIEFETDDSRLSGHDDGYFIFHKEFDGWGSAHSLTSKFVLDQISQPHFNDHVEIVSVVEFGDDALYCFVKSPHIKLEYHGMCDIIITGLDEHPVKFRRDVDI